MLKSLQKPRKIRDEVADRLKQFIASQNLQPGDRLPTETELAQQFGVSRLSLREATKALEFLEIVHSRPGVGLTVGRMNLQRLTEHLGFHPSLHDADPFELIDSRIVIEVGILPHAAGNMASDSSLYEGLQAIVDRSRSATRLQEWIDLDIEFHRALIQASGLSPLIAFADLLQTFFQQFRDSVRRAEWKSGIASHQRIIDCLQQQDVVAATTELTAHIESHKQRTKERS